MDNRQIVPYEANEGKAVFQTHHPRLRSAAQLPFDKESTDVAADFVCWPAASLHENSADTPRWRPIECETDDPDREGHLSLLRFNSNQDLRSCGDTGASGAGCL